MTAPAAAPRLWVTVTALALLLGLQPLTTDLYLPALPMIELALSAPMGALQLTMSALILAFGCAQLVWGPISDRYGRRPVLLTALALYVLAGLACAAAPRIEWLVAARAAQGAALAAAVVLARAMVRDLYEPLEGAQVMSRGMSGLGLIAIASVPAGGLLTQHFGWRSTLLTVALVGLVALAFVARFLPETLRQRNAQALKPGPLLSGLRTAAAHPTFRAWALLVTCTYGGLFILLSTSAFVYIRTLGLTPLAYGLALASNSVAYLVGTVCCRRWVARHGMLGAVSRGARFTAVGAVALGLIAAMDGTQAAPPWPVLVAAQWLYAFGHGIHQPCGQTGAVGPFPHMAGTASALAGFILASTAFCIGLVLGEAFEGSVRFMAAGMALWGAATALVAWTLVRRHGEATAPAREPGL